MQERIKKLISGGENQKVEFKEATFQFPRDTYETICAFLNTDGGIILLGVDDDGNIQGVTENCVDEIKDCFSSDINNPTIISPVIYMDMENISIEGKQILYINVPASSCVHRYKNKIYKRSFKSDIDITNNHDEVSKLYLNKDSNYTENKIYPYLETGNLRQDLIDRVKKLAKLNNPRNDWQELSTEQFLKRNSLYQTNFETGQKGVTLACILLFGTDEQIASVAPAFKFDLIKQVDDVERYDDRLTLRTNLLDCFDAAMKFISNHLPDPFYKEGNQRISLRDNIFRELIANMIVHKEYVGAEPTRLIIQRNEIIAENSSKPYIRGFITPENVTNHPKNPNIIKIFRGIGYVEEMGSGISNMYKYCREYSHKDPVLEDNNIFKFSLKHNFFPVVIHGTLERPSLFDLVDINKTSDQVSDQASDQVSDQVFLEKTILEFCVDAKSLTELLKRTGYSNRTHFRNRILKPLLEKGLIELTDKKSPNSPKQKYVTVIKGKDLND